MNTPVVPSPTARSYDTAPAFRLATRATGFRPSAIRELLKVTEAPEVISFAGGLPAPELFPIEAVARAAALAAGDSATTLQYSTTEGFRPLREWVCAHLAGSIGLVAAPEQVLITHGSQQGLDLVAKVLLDPGDVVLVENPAYLGALQAFHAYEANVVGVSADAGGVQPDALYDALVRAPRRPKFIYLVPNFQNPTGTSLATARRAEVVRLAAEHGVPVIEDDPYGCLRYSGDPSPALSALPGALDWIYLGTASKILAPGLRVAWLVASNRRMHEKLVAAKQAADLHTSTFTQRLVWECVRAPDTLGTHIVRLCTVYAERRDAMLAALAQHLPDGSTWTRPDGGLFLWVTLPEKFDATELLPRAMEQRVAFVPGESFWVGSPRKNTLRLNFSNASATRIEEGIARLGRVMAGH
ncbi:MAG TPA: PLP-dependent aminotransferase family protein [Opitutaceae bacterium]|nr:PLP-dependent aminotransferase family protein [Opitutaceae bacterium]